MENKIPVDLADLLLKYPDFCRGRLEAINACMKRGRFQDLPIVYTENGPIWVNRKMRRSL